MSDGFRREVQELGRVRYREAFSTAACTAIDPSPSMVLHPRSEELLGKR